MLRTRALSQNGVIKNMVYILYTFLAALGIFILIYPVTILILLTTGQTSGDAIQYLNINILNVFIIYIGMFTYVSIYSYYLKSTLGYNSTRREFFLGSFAAKIGYSVTSVLMLKLMHFLTILFLSPHIDKLLGAIKTKEILPLILITIVACSLGELLGIMICRLGKWGMYVYVLSIVVLCGGMGALFGAGIAGDAFSTFFDGGGQLRLQSMMPIAGGMIILFTAISWLMFRKIEVRQ